MRKVLSALTLAFVLSVPVIAGEIPIPPAPPAPPPCTENCTQQATSPAPGSSIPAFVVQLIIRLLG